MIHDVVYRAVKCPSCGDVIPVGIGKTADPFRIPLFKGRALQLTCPKCRTISQTLISEAFDTTFEDPLLPGELEEYQKYVRDSD
jgi:phage FluMu protein Com